jgi:hypothetical protein
MNNVEDVWWCRTPKNSVVYGSGERRIRGQRRIALHCLCSRIRDFPLSGLFSTPNNPSVEVKVYIPYGNYNSSSFMSQFIASVLASNSTLGTGLSITLNVVTNRFTVSHTSYSILFYFDSTISPVMGLPSYSLGFCGLGSSNQLLSYTCNFTGIQNINVHIPSMNTDNIDSLTKSTTNIIQSIPVDTNQSQIIFKKTDSFAFTVKEDVITMLNITLNDDLGQLVDFNNQHWNMTLCFTTFIDMERFNHNFSFRHILRYGYS